jgi:hypothetical protein
MPWIRIRRYGRGPAAIVGLECSYRLAGEGAQRGERIGGIGRPGTGPRERRWRGFLGVMSWRIHFFVTGSLKVVIKLKSEDEMAQR